MSEQNQEVPQPDQLGPSPEEQEAEAAKRLSEQQEAQEEHRRRVAPGGAELPEPVTGVGPAPENANPVAPQTEESNE